MQLEIGSNFSPLIGNYPHSDLNRVDEEDPILPVEAPADEELAHAQWERLRNEYYIPPYFFEDPAPPIQNLIPARVEPEPLLIAAILGIIPENAPIPLTRFVVETASLTAGVSSLYFLHRGFGMRTHYYSEGFPNEGVVDLVLGSFFAFTGLIGICTLIFINRQEHRNN